ncbi:MAG: tetraacyldisaccharide 4'-kinase [Candidatus Delongbacteria bacterium]|nr:tetraacyldisaccharide 4'-kinase [Candidatus Delongbacteria bacterium]
MGLFKNKIYFFLLSPLLLIFTTLYSIAVYLRHSLYELKIFRSYKVPGKIISVGNITVGGTGKTPTVISLVHELLKAGKRTVVVSRGYKRKSSDQIVVHDGKTLLGNVVNSGDEPLIIASSTGVPTICDPDRVSASNFAIENFDPEFIVLDDAFQHRKIKKDIDIVLVDERRFLGNKFLLPFGILRDFIFRLNSADILILSKVNSLDKKLIPKLKYLKKYGKKVLISYVNADRIKNNQQEILLDSIHDKNIYLFCGIGDPDNFYSSFENMKVSGKRSFSDHHYYSINDINAILETGADYIITTLKDFVKLPEEFQTNERLFYLDISLDLYSETLDKTSILENIYLEKPEWRI